MTNDDEVTPASMAVALTTEQDPEQRDRLIEVCWDMHGSDLRAAKMYFADMLETLVLMIDDLKIEFGQRAADRITELGYLFANVERDPEDDGGQGG